MKRALSFRSTPCVPRPCCEWIIIYAAKVLLRARTVESLHNVFIYILQYGFDTTHVVRVTNMYKKIFVISLGCSVLLPGSVITLISRQNLESVDVRSYFEFEYFRIYP